MILENKTECDVVCTFAVEILNFTRRHMKQDYRYLLVNVHIYRALNNATGVMYRRLVSIELS